MYFLLFMVKKEDHYCVNEFPEVVEFTCSNFHTTTASKYASSARLFIYLQYCDVNRFSGFFLKHNNSKMSIKQTQCSCNCKIIGLFPSLRFMFFSFQMFISVKLQGVPLRIELGPRDVKKNQLVLVRRDTSDKQTVPFADVVSRVRDMLETIQTSMYDR